MGPSADAMSALQQLELDDPPAATPGFPSISWIGHLRLGSEDNVLAARLQLGVRTRPIASP